MKILALVALALTLLSGCATITGTATGAVTGLVDLPAETYRANCEEFHEYPILYGLDTLVLAPVGAVTGPVMGFVKGVSLDVQFVAGHVEYGKVFGSYQCQSIWRPHTIYWPTRGKCAAPGFCKCFGAKEQETPDPVQTK